jgi:hypothetical protein
VNFHTHAKPTAAMGNCRWFKHILPQRSHYIQQEGSWENKTEIYINETYSQNKASVQVYNSYWILGVINLKS